MLECQLGVSPTLKVIKLNIGPYVIIGQITTAGAYKTFYGRNLPIIVISSCLSRLV
jgi:hypothetical protein